MLSWRTIYFLSAFSLLAIGVKMHSLYERRLDERPVAEPSPWKQTVQVRGQPLPIPKQWLTDREAREAHDLILPQALGQLMPPFDFAKARWTAWMPWGKSVGDQYLEHLCTYDAGEWVFKVTEPQEGIYLARVPEPVPDKDLWLVWDYEAPLLQHSWNRRPDDPPPSPPHLGWDLYYGASQWAGWAGDDDRSHYRFVEFANTGKSWQKPPDAPYFRAWGYQHDQGLSYPRVLQRRPMQLAGLSQPTARYGITWRGLRREQDREHRISGYEQIAYDLKTKEVIALRRQFVRMKPQRREPTFGNPDRCIRIHNTPNYQEDATRPALIAIRSATGSKLALFKNAHPKPFEQE